LGAATDVIRAGEDGPLQNQKYEKIVEDDFELIISSAMVDAIGPAGGSARAATAAAAAAAGPVAARIVDALRATRDPATLANGA
jgi:hypothetical protein